MNQITFGTKAETLDKLRGVIKEAIILPQLRFTSLEWKISSDLLLEKLSKEEWAGQSLIARSSGLSEDGYENSLAGHYVSVANLCGREEIISGIEKVVNSFDNNDNNQIFLQPMLSNVAISGVAFSREPSSGGPYVVINYDDITGSTDTVTSGVTNDLRTLYVFKDKRTHSNSQIEKVLRLIYELEEILGIETLDIEFAFDDKDLYLFQVRPLHVLREGLSDFDKHKEALIDIEMKISKMMRPHPYLHGEKTVFGIMPDWNPAEIVGVKPRPLALSLYKELITDNIWAYQRDNYGYKNLRSFPLLINFFGLPYIDVRVSFNSFVPEDVDAELSEKLVNYYIKRLVDSPGHHDKVEFEIIYSCYTLDLPDRLEVLKQCGFTSIELDDFSKSLRALTNKIIHGDNGLWKKDIKKIEKLEQRRKTILESDLDKISKIYWLLEDCKRYGTLPFAGLARAGFIAVQLLKSLVKVNVISVDEYEAFMGQLETVSSQSNDDFCQMSPEAYLVKYGHLRPGTYDIMSPRYDEAPQKYFNWSQQTSGKFHEKSSFKLSLEQLGKLEQMLVDHELDHNVLGLFAFIKGAIEGREYSKFVFTRSLSDVLSLCKELALENGFSVEDCSFADIDIIRKLYASSANAKELLEKSIREGKNAHSLTRKIILPPLLLQPDDVWSFEIPVCDPNFITLKSVSASVAKVSNDNTDLKGKILFIESADPGYDWIFSHGIVGFITMYGGVNSHMAIRAGELGIPAVIGAGEALYGQWGKASVLYIDCENRQVKVLR